VKEIQQQVQSAKCLFVQCGATVKNKKSPRQSGGIIIRLDKEIIFSRISF
jgi:hypothetical protein